MSARNVLYVSPNAHLGGAEKACELFLKWHDRKKYAPAIAFLRDGPLVQEFKRLDVPVFALPPVRVREVFKHGQLIRGLMNIIKHEGIDLVHGTMAYGHFFGGRAANNLGIKNVWFQHGPVFKKFDRWVSLIHTDTILVNSRYTELEQRKITYRNFPTEVVYAGIDEPNVSEGEAATRRAGFRRKLGFHDENIVCGSVGRIQDWKGQLEFLQAFAVAHRQTPSLRAVICGGSDLGQKPYEQKLKDFVRNQNLENVVTMTGFIDDLEAAYRSFDILIHSTVIAEPFGLVPLEGMIRRLPVIACPWGGPAETVENEKTGLLVNPRDTRALAEAIGKLAAMPELRTTLGAQGERAARRFVAPAFVKRVEDVYDSLFR